MAKGFDSTNSLLRGLFAASAFFPSVAVYNEAVGIPRELLGAAKIISPSVTAVVLVCILLLADRISAISPRRIAVFAVIGVSLGIGSFIGFRQFAESHIGTWQTREGQEATFIIPIFPEDEVRSTVKRQESPNLEKGYERALEGAGGATFKELLDSDDWDSFSFMVLLLVLTQALLVAPPVAAAWRATAPAEGDAAVEPQPAPAGAGGPGE